MNTQLLTDLAPAPIQRAADPLEVAKAMEQEISDFASGPFLLEEVGLSWRLRKDEEQWRGTVRVTWRPYMASEPKMTRVVARLTLDTEDADPAAQTSEVDGAETERVPFGTPGWSGHLNGLGIALSCEHDEGLPILSSLLDPQQGLKAILPLLQKARIDLPKVVDCHPSVLRYKHGSRCTIGYELETVGQSITSVPNPVIAKTYAGRKGEIAHEAMNALWASELRHSKNVAIAEPLGYDPQQSLLLQGPVAGDTPLKSMMINYFSKGEGSLDHLERLVRATARGLADLHLCSAPVGEERVWRTDLDELTSRRDRVVGAMPGVESYGSELIAALEALDAQTSTKLLVPTHGSFRAAQVLVDGENIAFIDFDSFAQAEPALDVAEFAFRMEQLALVKTANKADDGHHDPSQRGAEVDRLTTAFLAEYRTMAPVDEDRIALWWTVGALSLVFSSFIKLKLARVPACLSLVDRATTRFGLTPADHLGQQH